MQISQDVLAVLSTLTVEHVKPGNPYAAIKMPQLDRKLYTKVNEVLEAIGGTWSRKEKAHTFGAGPEAIAFKLDMMIVVGEVETAQEIGFFPTPEKLAQELVELADVRRGMTALEPSAGSGRIARELFRAGAVVTVIERDLEMRDTLKHGTAGCVHGRRWSQVIDTVEDCDDFMTYQSDDWFDRIVMNPPFYKVGLGDHLDHVRHAHDGFLKPDGVLVAVLPAGVTFRQDKRHTEFRRWIADRGGEIAMLPDDSFRESGTRVRTCRLRMKGARW